MEPLPNLNPNSNPGPKPGPASTASGSGAGLPGGAGGAPQPSLPGRPIEPPVDLNNLVYRTMPKGSVPSGANLRPLIRPGESKPAVLSGQTSQTPGVPIAPAAGAMPGAIPNSRPGSTPGAGAVPVATLPTIPGLPGTPNFSRAAEIGSGSGSQSKSKLDLAMKIILWVLAAGFVIFAGLFAYKHFIVKPPTSSNSLTVNQNPGTPTSGSAGSNANGSSAAGSGNGTDNSGQNNQTPSQPVSQIPSAWQQKYFGAATCADQNICGDSADPDHDGLTNLEEYKNGTDPNNPDTDGDGLADGDEIHVFNQDPNSAHTAGIAKFTDSGDLKYKYNSHTHASFTDAELVQIAANIKQYGLHEPTMTTLGADLVAFYTNYVSAQTQTQSGQPQSGALDRDTQRSYTIKQISYALLSYDQTNKSYPDTTDFPTMVNTIKPLLAGKAVNAIDPTNVAPYVYTYQPLNNDTDFQIGYFSETQHQEVILRAADAQAALNQDQQTQRDIKRVNDLEQISGALELYSADHANPNNPQQKVYPPQPTWKQALSTKYLAIIPVDPKTNQDYVYTVSSDNASYGLTATLELPPTGKTTYVCTQDGCDYQ